jgi:outer membrane protein assembly factor BamA
MLCGQPDARRYPIEKVEVEGTKYYDPALIARLAGVKPGEILADVDLDAAQRRIEDSGAFAYVSYFYGPAPSEKGYIVRFELKDFEQRMTYRLEGLPVDDAKARAWLREKAPMFGDEIPASEKLVERFRKLLGEFAGTGVAAKINSDKDGKLHVLFYPEGGLPSVALVRFSGNQVLPLTLLQNTINGVAIGTVYREDTFRELLGTSIVPLYEERGRLRVQFPKVAVKPARGEVRGLEVDVTVDEGPSYSLGAVQVTGTGFNAELAKEAKLKPGDVANIQAVREGQQRIHAALRRNGFMNAKSTIERKIDDAGKSCDFLFRVDMGERYTFGKLFFKGLDIHGEHELRRIWGMEGGKAFNADYPDYFLAKIREEGLFDGLENAKAILAPDEKARTVDVTLVFNEKKPPPRQP